MRLFFALWPPAEAARQLARWAGEVRRRSGGRAVREEAIHLTLAFLGEVTSERASRAVAAARRVKALPHEFAIEEAQYWPHNRIVWAGPCETPAPLAQLAQNLQRELEAEGFGLERRQFAAHVTLLRKARASAPIAPPPRLNWLVDEFVLVNSTPSREGSRYGVLERFPLAGGR